tara:strand:+ start:932 stop:1978 length:1047 start_codon:yes stop_codon:yes gene_type:complete
MIYSNPTIKLNDLKFYYSSIKKNILIDNYPNIFWSNSSAESFAIIYNSFKKNEKNIYLPKYFCGQSLSYLRGINANIIFYDIDDNFNIDFDKIEFTRNLSKSDIFVVVHYFGQISDYTKLLQLKEKINFTIIEDCAHVNKPSNSRKWIGDFLIFSPHKHFPVPTIGLILSKTKINFNYTNSKKINIKWFFKQLLKKILNLKLTTKWKTKWSKNINTINCKGPNNLLIKISENYIYHDENINNIYKKNYIEAYSILKKYPDWSILKCDNEHPYGIIVKCKSSKIAKSQYYKFNEKYNLVMQWPDLPIEIRFLKNYNEIVQLTDQILFFFVDSRKDNHKWINELKRQINE